MIVEATVINSEPFDGTITCCSTQKFIDIYIEQVYDITMSTGESNPNQPNSDGNRCDSGRDGEPAAISGDLVGASEGAPELDELVAIAAQRCRLDHRESVLLAEIAQTDVCDVLHGHHPNVWFADRTRQARYTASSRVRTAQRLHNRYGELADALAAGVVGWQHVVVFDRAANSRIRAAMIELLPGIINLAQVATFERWSQEVRGIADRLDQDGGYDPATDPTNNQLHLVPTTGGITYISGQLVGELALTIKKLIDGETDRVLTRYRSDAEASDGDIPVPSRAQAAAEALGELVDRASSIPDATGKLPEPEIVVILNDQTGDLTDDDGNHLSPVILRFIIAAGLIRPLEMAGSGDPLRMGRTLRCANRHQRRALTVRDGGCLFPGCGRPAHWCDAHHADHWDTNGTTDIENLALLCRHHHRVTHRPGWAMTRDQDTGDPNEIRFRWRTPTCRLLESQRHHQRSKPAAA